MVRHGSIVANNGQRWLITAHNDHLLTIAHAAMANLTDTENIGSPWFHDDQQWPMVLNSGEKKNDDLQWLHGCCIFLALQKGANKSDTIDAMVADNRS